MTQAPHLNTFMAWFVDTLAVTSIQIVVIHYEPQTFHDIGMGYFIQNPWEFLFSGKKGFSVVWKCQKHTKKQSRYRPGVAQRVPRS